MSDDEMFDAAVRGGMTPSTAFELFRATIGDEPAATALACYEQKVGRHHARYRLYIVLAESRDTQQRLRDQLLGPSNKRWIVLPSVEDDLRPSGSNINAFLASESHLKVVCVVEKKEHDLRGLLSWLRSGEPSVLADCPALVVDETDDGPDAVSELVDQVSRLLPKAVCVP